MSRGLAAPVAFAEPGEQPINACGGCPQREHEACARGIAERRLAVRVEERGAAFSQRVELRRFRQRMPAERADPVILVIDRDEKVLKVFLCQAPSRDRRCRMRNTGKAAKENSGREGAWVSLRVHSASGRQTFEDDLVFLLLGRLIVGAAQLVILGVVDQRVGRSRIVHVLQLDEHFHDRALCRAWPFPRGSGWG